MGGRPGRKVEDWLEEMKDLHWQYKKSEGGHSHPAGTLRCGLGCRKVVYSTPKAGDDEQLKRLKRFAKRCPHGRDYIR